MSESGGDRLWSERDGGDSDGGIVEVSERDGGDCDGGHNDCGDGGRLWRDLVVREGWWSEAARERNEF